MEYLFPFGQQVHSLIQQDRTSKKVFVLGIYASAVHARWKINGKTVCVALAVASEPRIFWDGNIEEAKAIISKIYIPKETGHCSLQAVISMDHLLKFSMNTSWGLWDIQGKTCGFAISF